MHSLSKKRIATLVGALALLLPSKAYAAESEEARFEVTPVPIVGGSTDIGFGGGALVSLARVGPSYDPYLYRVEAAGMVTFKPVESGGFEVPYQDYYLLLSLPVLASGRLKLDLRASFTRETNLKYYGLGNASELAPGTELTNPQYLYERTHPELRVSAKRKIKGPFWSEVRLAGVLDRLDVPSDGKLAEDSRSGNPVVEDELHFFPESESVVFGYGLVFDTRDDEVSASSGQFHSTRFDWSPGGTGDVPYRYSRWATSLRLYLPLPLAKSGSTLALRAVSDLLFGDPPVYELARYDETSAIGGPKGVRGVPAQRFNGMVKLFGNVEWRQLLFDFHFLGKQNTLGFAAFADAGRLWTNYDHNPELDGTSLGLKFGLGGGPRLVAGESFALRLDVAWSPDADPIGAYLNAGQLF